MRGPRSWQSEEFLQSGPLRNIGDREFMTSQTGAKLFHLMEIRSDRQELSYVEKIILQRRHIVSFCETLNVESTREESPQGGLSLSFEKLDRSSLNVVGFYGSKELLTETLKSCNAITSGDEVHSKMCDDSLFPGLYALLCESILYVFYWHRGRVLPQASRKDISCNFVRYLVDLCDYVFILLEGSGGVIREALNTGSIIAKTRRQVRTRRMKVEKLQATENKVEVLPGFTLRLVTCGSLPWENNSLDGISTRFWICEGTRCGFLSYTRNPETKHLRLQDISSRTQIFDGKSVDYTSRELKDEDLSLFLQCSGCRAGKQYVQLLDDFEKRSFDLKSSPKNEQDRELRLKIYEREVEKTVTEFISEYLRTAPRFSWEEELLANASLEDLEDILLTSKLQEGMKRDAPANNSQGFIKRIGKSFFEVFTRNSKDSRIDFQAKHYSLQKLENKIFTGFGRWNQVLHKFIFPSNRITVRQGDFKDSTPQTYIVDKPGYGTAGEGKPNDGGPLCHHDLLVLRAVNSKQQQSKEMTVWEKDTMYDAPIITNMLLSGSSDGVPGEYFLDVVDDEFAPGGLEEWVALEANRILPQLGNKACLLSYVLGNGDDKIWSEIQQVLELPNDKFLEAIVKSLKSEAIDDIRARWTEICAGASKATTLRENVVRQCSAVYEKARGELFSTFHKWFRRNMTGLLQTWIQQEDEESLRFLEENLEEEKGKILRDLRENDIHRDQNVVKLRSCRLAVNDFDNFGSHLQEDLTNVRKLLGKSADPGRLNYKLVLVYDVEESEKQSEKWHVQELSPSKHDLEKIEMDGNHTFTPIQQGERHVLSLDTSTQRLLKLAFLKNGQYLAFILTTEGGRNSCKVVLIPTAGRQLLVTTMNHGFDVIAFDEQTRFLALYDQSKLVIKTYRFDEGYKHLDFSGAEIYLSELDVSSVTWMKFVPGMAEVIFVDSDHTVRVFEMAVPGIVRAKEIQLPGPLVNAEVTRQGPCLLVFNESTTEDKSITRAMTTTLQMEVYRIDLSMSHVSTIPVHTIKRRNLPNLHFEVAVRSFGLQEQLLLYMEEDPQKIVSQALKITLPSEQYKLFCDTPSKIGCHQPLSSGLALDYLYHVYEKFSTNPPLAKQSRALSFYVVVNEQDLKSDCLNYVDSCFKKLQTEKGKNFHGLDKQCVVCQARETSLILAQIGRNDRRSGKRGLRRRSMGDWIRQLLCLVPIQIARAENNCLTPLADGLEFSEDVDYENTISLASVLHFGFYEVVFASWRNKPVKIISSMGKQSSGKSYLLNHLSGSLLDVSGGRCTDGVWMTVRISDDVDEKACMYVLLDFEAEGTFERSEQEDMLLCVLNAAISNITIYNKKDFNLDRETETVFERFQNGVSMVKADDRLFKGIFYIAVKDVGEEDAGDLYQELAMKIHKIVENSKENFLTKMYGGRVTLGLMAPFDKPHFYGSIDQIYDTINDRELKASYTDGRSFSTDLRLLIAQLCAKDWSSTDSKRMELRVYLIRVHLNTAINMGRLDSKGTEVSLVNFDSQEEIGDDPIHFGDNVFAIRDTGLKLIPCDDGDSIGDILKSVKEVFHDVVRRSGEDDERWHAAFIQFLEKLGDRRRRRVMEWISSNVQTFKHHDEIQRIELEATALCTEMKQKLSICSCTCEKCFLRCTKEKGHSQGHCCLGDHRCSQTCSYCVRDNDEDISINKCRAAAGHQGSHNCNLKEKSHTCEENCLYHGVAANCNRTCAGMADHSGKHLCNSREHKCSETCSLASCTNPCVHPFEVADHAPHSCHEKFCPIPCSMKGCNRRCASQNHFHEDELDVKHFCDVAHPCPEKCQARGNCAVQQNGNKITEAKHDGNRRSCCRVIPPFQTTHGGLHSHTLNLNVVHFCDTFCRACGYFCTQPIGHAGIHNPACAHSQSSHPHQTKHIKPSPQLGETTHLQRSR